MKKPCGPSPHHGLCPANIQARIRDLAVSNCQVMCNLNQVAHTALAMKQEMKRAKDEKNHLLSHLYCTPLNCVIKQCGPNYLPPCHKEMPTQKDFDELRRKYIFLWCHLTQKMSERSCLKVENYLLEKEIAQIKEKYEPVCVCPAYICDCAVCKPEECPDW